MDYCIVCSIWGSQLKRNQCHPVPHNRISHSDIPCSSSFPKLHRPRQFQVVLFDWSSLIALGQSFRRKRQSAQIQGWHLSEISEIRILFQSGIFKIWTRWCGGPNTTSNCSRLKAPPPPVPVTLRADKSYSFCQHVFHSKSEMRAQLFLHQRRKQVVFPSPRFNSQHLFNVLFRGESRALNMAGDSRLMCTAAASASVKPMLAL